MEFDRLKTPCYIIRQEEYIKNINEIMDSFNNVWNNNVIFGYSVKTNHFPALMEEAKNKKWYAEVVSTDEYNHALEVKFNKDNIILNGPSKGNCLSKAIKNNCIINIDNFDEIRYICKNKKYLKCKIGLRVNFELEKYVPGETTTGNEIGRFGINYENGDLKKAIELLNKNKIKINGLHMHQSTSTRSLNVFKAISKKAVEIAKKYNLQNLEYIDIGGGYFGGNYFKGKPKIKEYAEVISKELKQYFDSKNTTLVIEPGAAILATACDYLTSVVNIREIKNTKVVTVDGSCLHINPFMKNSQVNPCTILNHGNLLKNKKQLIGGSTCMEMDRLYPMNNKYELKANSKLLFHCAGAYTMTHNNNFINLPPYVYIESNNKYRLLRNKKNNTMLL